MCVLTLYGAESALQINARPRFSTLGNEIKFSIDQRQTRDLFENLKSLVGGVSGDRPAGDK
jgi:hypothetical protein